MTPIREIVKLVDYLTESTQNNTIQWQRNEPPTFLLSHENKIDFVYVTELQGRNIRLYKESYKYYTDEERYYWDERIIIEFIDEYGGSIWQFPKTNNLWNLLNAVQYKDANVDDF